MRRRRVDAKFLVTADLNGDDETDWLIANSVFINDGAGKLVWASEVAGDYWMDTVVGGIDGDQNADVITLHSDTEECGLARFDREAAGEAASCDVVMAIHDGIHLCPEGERCFQGEDDGDMGFCHPPRCAYGVIHLGAGDGTFTESGRFDIDRPWWNENVGNLARLVDLDGDGHLDLVSRTPFSQEEGSTVLQRGVGDGSFEEATVLQERGPSPRQDLFVADVDGDDDIDLISGNQVLFNDGHGAFPNDVTLTTYLDSLTDGVHPGDVDGDGRVELVVVDFNDDATTLISVLQVEESGVTPLHRFCDERRGNLSDVADLDGDGKAELLVGYQFSGLTVYGF